MSRPKLRSSSQSWPVWLALGLYEFCASLKLAVLLIFSLAFVLGWATFVESNYGTSAVQFGAYGTWWFEWLNVLLAINIFCAAAIRYPWKRHQTGFVITHIGLLTLLLGSWIQRQGSIDAQMPVLEGDWSRIAYDEQLYLQVKIETLPGPAGSSSAAVVGTVKPEVQTVSIPFDTGPFNWEDYQRMTANEFFFQLAHRDVGKISDPSGVLAKNGIEIESLDYFSNSREISVPAVTMNLGIEPRAGAAADPRMPKEISWNEIELQVTPAPGLPLGRGQKRNLGGGAVCFWLLGSPAELQAFLTKPDPKLGFGKQGQVVLYADGKPFQFVVDEHVNQGPFDFPGTDLKVEVQQHYPLAMLDPHAAPGELRLLPVEEEPGEAAVELLITRGEQKQRLVLLSKTPFERAAQAELGVYGSYWVGDADKNSMELLRGQGGARLDLVQGPDLKLYYRRWNRREVLVAEKLPADVSPVVAFEMPVAIVKFFISPKDRFTSAVPAVKNLPLPFDKQMKASAGRRVAEFRVTVDGKAQTGWVVGHGLYDELIAKMAQLAGIATETGQPAEAGGLRPEQQFRIAAGNKIVTLSLPAKPVDVGYRVELKEFQKKLDPGTNQASHFGSKLDFLDGEGQPVTGGKGLPPLPGLTDVQISMNAPVDVLHPESYRMYRFFQESFQGPHRVGDRDRFVSVLTVNYSPGRGITYLGSALIVAGIFTMFYMRAYFFKRVSKPRITPVAETTAAGVR